MKPLVHLAIILACALLTGCHTKGRSISHSDYRKDQSASRYHGYDPDSDPDFAYRGELSEFDVLGIVRDEITSEAEIRRALQNAKRVRLHRASSILLIQSGALFPDGPMVTELGRHFTVVPFSGVPDARNPWNTRPAASVDPENYAKSLRLAAARGGNDTILCYWGMLESESRRLPTKTVSWVPVVNWTLPDETRHMRIRLKVALIDVASGNWTVFSPPPFEDQRLSLAPRRAAVDQHQVARLKQAAYEACARELVSRFAETGL